MKYVELFWVKGWDSKTVLEAVTSQASQGASYQEALKRLRVLEVLEKIKEGDSYVALEDADHQTLIQAIDSFKFGAVTREMMKVCQAAKEASDARREPDRVPDGGVSNGRIPDNPVRAGQRDSERVDIGRGQNGHLDPGSASGEYVER